MRGGKTTDKNNENRITVAGYVRVLWDEIVGTAEQQMERIRDFAAAHNMDVVRFYTDDAVETTSTGEYACEQFERMLSEIEGGSADFQLVLIQDRSRWGVSPDGDDGEYLEYICRRSGVDVLFCSGGTTRNRDYYPTAEEQLMRFGRPAEEEQPAVRAAMYVRMSTEHQQYSTENQMDRMKEYAAERNMEIAHVYSDEGKSGLRIEGRDALKQLILDVENGKADFDVILVYDVSRWGRFQDADESGYYEYLCRKAGIRVIYCAEQFTNDGSPVATIVKGVKRAMAGEYSRELSEKVFDGQCRLIRMGYRQGGPAGYGLRRLLIDQTGKPKTELAIGEMKSIQTDRVILVPGPDGEVETVRWIYRQFVEAGKFEREIADMLNARGIKTDFGRKWTRGSVQQVLTNEKYIGNNVYNRISFKLKMIRIKNPPDLWVRADGVFNSIVEPSLFYQAQGIITERARKFTNEELIEKLKALYNKNGYLSGIIIDECEDLPGSSVFQRRFGSLIRAYRLVGYEPDRDYAYIEINRYLRRLHPKVVDNIVGQMRDLGGSVERDANTDLVRVNAEFTASLVISRCLRTDAGSYRWNIRMDAGLAPDITVAARMDGANRRVLDYYLLPTIDMAEPKIRLAEDNGIYLDIYRFDDLEYLFGMAKRAKLKEAV